MPLEDHPTEHAVITADLKHALELLGELTKTSPDHTAKHEAWDLLEKYREEGWIQ